MAHHYFSAKIDLTALMIEIWPANRHIICVLILSSAAPAAGIYMRRKACAIAVFDYAQRRIISMRTPRVKRILAKRVGIYFPFSSLSAHQKIY